MFRRKSVPSNQWHGSQPEFPLVCNGVSSSGAEALCWVSREGSQGGHNRVTLGKDLPSVSCSTNGRGQNWGRGGGWKGRTPPLQVYKYCCRRQDVRAQNPSACGGGQGAGVSQSLGSQARDKGTPFQCHPISGHSSCCHARDTPSLSAGQRQARQGEQRHFWAEQGEADGQHGFLNGIKCCRSRTRRGRRVQTGASQASAPQQRWPVGTGFSDGGGGRRLVPRRA